MDVCINMLSEDCPLNLPNSSSCLIKLNNAVEMIQFTNHLPHCLNFTPEEFTTLPFPQQIVLHVFTDGILLDDYKIFCLQNYIGKSMHVRLHYLGNDESAMSMAFVDIFRGCTIDLHLNERPLAQVNPNLEWTLTDSLKASVLAKSFYTDKEDLEEEILENASRMWENHLRDPPPMRLQLMYFRRDVQKCADYIQNKCASTIKSDFESRLAGLLSAPDIRSMHDFMAVQPPKPLLYKRAPLILDWHKLDVADCILISVSRDRNFPLPNCENPFFLSEHSVSEMGKLLEINASITSSSEFVYVVPRLSTTEYINHNNSVLVNFFQNNLPGSAFLWHIFFLYVASQKAASQQDGIYEEIKFLAREGQYFLSLDPHSPPYIYENLNVCFWFLAEVCQREVQFFPFYSQMFLKFYDNVYKMKTPNSKALAEWILRKNLKLENASIMSILSHYFYHDKLGEGPFGHVLYENVMEFPTPPDYLGQLDLGTVLKVYRCVLNEPKDEKMFCHFGHFIAPEETYLMLFKKYCVERKKYPTDWKEWLMFINEYCFVENGKMPIMFPYFIGETVEKMLTKYRERVWFLNFEEEML